MTPVMCHSQPTQCAYIGFWRGGAARPLRTPGLTKKRAEIIVDTVFGNVVEALQHGEKVELRGFGSFRLRRREPRRGRNPRTGDRVDVPPRRVPYFKPGKDLKELINRDPA